MQRVACSSHARPTKNIKYILQGHNCFFFLRPDCAPPARHASLSPLPFLKPSHNCSSTGGLVAGPPDARVRRPNRFDLEGREALADLGTVVETAQELSFDCAGQIGQTEEVLQPRPPRYPRRSLGRDLKTSALSTLLVQLASNAPSGAVPAPQSPCQRSCLKGLSWRHLKKRQGRVAALTGFRPSSWTNARRCQYRYARRWRMRR